MGTENQRRWFFWTHRQKKGAFMEQRLQQAVLERLQEILIADSQRETPVVQSVSLFFWQNLSRWVRQIALVPEPFILALAGPSGSGKSFIRETLEESLLAVSEVSSFTQDNYYRDFEADFPHLPLARFYDEIDFDDPAHILFRHLARDLSALKSLPLASTLQIPQLRFGTPLQKPSIVPNGLELRVAPFVVTEGIHAFSDASILPLYDFKIYVDIDEESRRQRWLARNQRENRGVTDNMWATTVDCLHQHLLPARQVADLIVNNNAPQARVAGFLQELVSVLSEPLRVKQRDIA